MPLKFNKTYLIVAVVLFITEILIATFFKYGFIRYTFGDYLVVILLYTALKSFIDTVPVIVAIPVLIFAFFIELLQLINILELLNLNNNHLLKLIFGSTFRISDLVAYTLGILTVLVTEYALDQINLKTNKS